MKEGMFTSIQVTEKSSKKKTETDGNYKLICDLNQSNFNIVAKAGSIDSYGKWRETVCIDNPFIGFEGAGKEDDRREGEPI